MRIRALPTALAGAATQADLVAPLEDLSDITIFAPNNDAFQRLAATVRPRPALTMEEHVTEMLRPMLRAWLDENLPPLVERLVQAEIERISRSR